MADIACPRCGAKGNENCTTVRGNDHRARILVEIADLERRRDEREAEREDRAACTPEHCGYPKNVGLAPGIDVSIDGDVWPGSPYAKHIERCPWHNFAPTAEPDVSEEVDRD